MKIANNQYPLSTRSVLVFHNSPVVYYHVLYCIIMLCINMYYPHCSSEETEGCTSIRLGSMSLPIRSRGR